MPLNAYKAGQAAEYSMVMNSDPLMHEDADFQEFIAVLLDLHDHMIISLPGPVVQILPKLHIGL